MDNIITAYDTLVATVVDAPRGLLEVHAGMAIYLGCLLMIGTRRGSLMAVLLVVACAVIYEIMSWLDGGTWSWNETTRALVLALFWPTLCYAASSFRRWNWSEKVREKARERLTDLYDYRPQPVTGPAGRDE